ncbi:MAG TPA: diguanylate cyclase [Trichocoleus sp.]
MIRSLTAPLPSSAGASKAPAIRRFILVQIGTWVGLITILALALLSQWNVRRSRAWVNHTFDVLEAVQALESDFLNADASLHKVASKDDLATYLDYRAALQAARTDINTLTRLTQDNPAQTQNLKRLMVLLDQDLLPREIAFRPETTPQLRAGLAQAQQQVETYRQTEQALLQQRRTRLNHQGMLTTGITIGAIVYSAVMFARVSFEQWQLRRSKHHLNERLESIQLEQELSESLLTCRSLGEAHNLLKNFLTLMVPTGQGVIFEINHSRDRMEPVLSFGEAVDIGLHPPHECWALRRGEICLGDQQILKLPCQLCQQLNPDNSEGMMCLPLQAHEQTLGVFHLTSVPVPLQPILITLARQIALPLAVLKLQTELEYLSVHDSNTGLYNRRFLDEMLQRSIAYADRQNFGFEPSATPYSVGLIFIDVDHFKRFNTDYGHDAGDVVLRALAQLLNTLTRQGVDVPCRYGGEEFLLILPGATLETTVEKAETIRQKVKFLNVIKGATISLSLGVSTYPLHGATAETALKAANTALLKAKFEGRDRVCIATFGEVSLEPAPEIA